MMKMHLHHFIGTVLLLGSVGSYFAFFWILSKYAKDDIRHLFEPTLGLCLVWLTLLLSVGSVFAFEYLMKGCKSVCRSKPRYAGRSN